MMVWVHSHVSLNKGAIVAMVVVLGVGGGEHTGQYQDESEY